MFSTIYANDLGYARGFFFQARQPLVLQTLTGLKLVSEIKNVARLWVQILADFSQVPKLTQFLFYRHTVFSPGTSLFKKTRRSTMFSSRTICEVQKCSLQTAQPQASFAYLMAIGGMNCNHRLWQPSNIAHLRKVLMLRFHPDKRSPHASNALFQMSMDLISLLRSHPFGNWPEDLLRRVGCCLVCRKEPVEEDLCSIRNQWQDQYTNLWATMAPSVRSRRAQRRLYRRRRAFKL